ncbi:MAG: hypothetical protein K9J06_06955 [Flavobacteriales bacterium]|nr:hypothetical protein [Flavobacteriales bacterium]
MNPQEFDDLSAFFAYRGLQSRLAGKLLDGLRNSSGPLDKEEVCQSHDLTDATFRTIKYEMEKTLLEWSILNNNGWVAPHLRNLIASHVLLHWGESQRAWKLAQEVQHQATADSHFAVARLALELRSALVQYVHPDDTSDQFNAIVGEIDELTRTAEVLKTVSRLYVKAGTLTTSSMLLRSAESIGQFEAIVQEFKEVSKQHPDLPFNTWAYHIQTEALLAEMRGEEQHVFRCYDLLWVKMNTDPRPIPLADHRFYQFIQTYILSAISAKAWPKAVEADLAHKTAISEIYGNPPLLKGMNHAFSVLIDIGHQGPDPARLKALSAVIANMARASTNEDGDFNIFKWNLHMASAILPMLLRHCFNLGLLKECEKLLGIVTKMTARNTSAATDLQAIAPLIFLAVRYGQLSHRSRKPQLFDPQFEARAASAYHHFRRNKELFVIEWELARLFHSLAQGRKDQKALFQRTSDRLAQLSNTCAYYKALMLMFDFEGWVEARTQAKA